MKTIDKVSKTIQKNSNTIMWIIVDICIFVIGFEIGYVASFASKENIDYPVNNQEIGESICFEFETKPSRTPMKDPSVMQIIIDRNEENTMPYITIDKSAYTYDSPKQWYIDLIDEVCESYNFIDDLPYLVQAIMEVESNYDPTVVSSANCVGLMQISKYWQADRIAKLRVTDIFDPYSNILVGVDFLEDLYYNYAHQDIWLTVMMYNMDFKSARAVRASGQLTPYALKVQTIFEELKGG